jgi:hypothetical protein
MKRLTRRGAALGATLMTAIGGTGAAWAWSIIGHGGNAVAHAAAVKDLTVSAGPNPVTGLYPTGSVDLVVTVANDNAFPVRVTSLAVDRGSITADSAHANNGCAWTAAQRWVWTTKITYVPPTSNNTVPPHNRLVLSFANAITMDTAASAACVGAEFAIPAEVTAVTP